MYSTQHLFVSAASRVADLTVCCDVVGHCALRISHDQMPALRRIPGPPYGEPLTTSTLKHLDEQTLVGLAAVYHAIHNHGLSETCFTDWGILAAPRFLGRANLAVALHRFLLEGAWGISPHLIPHHSLHSLSGTVSQALKVHGPNFGVGGGQHAADEGLLTAAALLAGDRVPGVWLIFTGYSPELVPENPATPGPQGNGKHTAVPDCLAVALALTSPDTTFESPRNLAVYSEPSRKGSGRLQIHIAGGAMPGSKPEQGVGISLFSLEGMLETLQSTTPHGGWHLNCGGWVELKRHGAENRS